ncbi:MAG: hypothetical protein DMG08_25500 [Acidobacteria bacterium]|nr:MAG: hypothetical protein DMG08_25500 [Acidobacteriota bacterium]
MTFPAFSRRRVVLAAALFCIPIFHAAAQVNTASIRGTVSDPSGAVVDGASITATNDLTGVSLTTVSNAQGIYVFPVLNLGAYTLAAEKQGFKKAVRKGIELQVNQTARIDLALEVGAVSEQVVVQEQIPLVEAETSSLGHVVTQRDVLDLPLNKRNFSQLAVLVPGANFGAAGTIGGGDRPDDPRPRSAFFVNGTRDSSNTYLIDGIDNYDRLHTTVAIKPSIDAVQEFKVQTSLYSAEFGRNAGGVVNVSVKSGTNEFRGSAYEFLRNQALDARNFFAPLTQPKPHYILNQFGGTLGGPVVHDKAFFFLSYEAFRERKGQTLTSTIPTLAMRNGDFSGLGTIYDPLTTTPSGSTFTRQAFPNNQIPATSMDAPAARLIQLYPQPTGAGLSNNFIWSPVREQNTHQVDTRIDRQIGSRGSLFGRYSFGDTNTITPAFLPGKAQGAANFSGPNMLRTQGLAIGFTRTLTPTLVNETRLGFTRIGSHVFPFFFGEKIADEVGIPNANQDNFSSGLTTISISGFRGLGNSSFQPIFKVVNSFQVTDNLNITRGRHILKVGGQIIRPQVAHFQSSNPAGLFSFNGNFTNNPASPAGTGNAMASFLLGYPASTSRTAQLSPTYLRWLEHSAYFQDDWKIHPRLTLNLGLRYELITAPVTVNDHLSNFDFQQGKVIIAGVGTSRSAGVKNDTNNFAPRAGFAFSLTPKTVVRGGYGIFYDSVPLFAQLRPFPFLLSYSRVPSAFQVENRMSEGFPNADFDIAKNAANPFGTVDAVPFDNPLGYVQQYNLNVQRSLAANIGLTVAYVGTLGRKLRWVYDENIPDPGPGAVQQRRPYFNVVPNVVGLRVNHAEASSAYHSLQIGIEKRMSNGFSFQTSYTWSHWIDNAVSEAGYGSQGPNPQDLKNRRLERGNDPADIRHRFVHSWIYELPFGNRKRWANQGTLLSHIVGGWQINGITALQGGLPFTVGVGSPVTNNGVGNRADRVTDGSLSRDQRTLARFFDTTAFRTPAQFQYGNSGRDILRGPGTVNFDFSLFRNVRFSEKRSLQFRSEFFNFFNTPQFGLPDGTLGATTFGTISTLANDMRQIQFSLKLLF